MTADPSAAPLTGLPLAAATAFAAGLHRAVMTLAPLTAAARSSAPAFAALLIATAAAEGLFLPLAKALSAAWGSLQPADCEGSRPAELADGKAAAGSKVDETKDPEAFQQQGHLALRLVLLGVFLFLLLSAPFVGFRFTLTALGFDPNLTQLAVRNFFLLLPGLFCRQHFIFFAKIGSAVKLQLPQTIAGVIGVATSFLFFFLSPQHLGVCAECFSAGYGAALLTEIGLLCSYKAFRAIFEACEIKHLADNWTEPCQRLVLAFILNFAEIAPFSLVFFIIARLGTSQLITVGLLLITEEAVTVVTRALAVGVRSCEGKSYTPYVITSALVFMVSSLQSLIVYNFSRDLASIFSNNRRVPVLYKSCLFGFLSFILITSLTKVWRSYFSTRWLPMLLLLLSSRWLFRFGLGMLLTLQFSKSFLAFLPIILPLGGVIEATGFFLLFAVPCAWCTRANDEKQLLCPKQTEKSLQGHVFLYTCGAILVSIACLILVIYACTQIK